MKKIWIDKAIYFIDKYKSGEIDDISINSIAHECGVSRQTIWRDKEIVGLLNLAKAEKVSQGDQSDNLTNSLKSKILEVNRINELLIVSIVNVQQRMFDDGIDPSKYFIEDCFKI